MSEVKSDFKKKERFIAVYNELTDAIERGFKEGHFFEGNWDEDDDALEFVRDEINNNLGKPIIVEIKEAFLKRKRITAYYKGSRLLIEFKDLAIKKGMYVPKS